MAEEQKQSEIKQFIGLYVGKEARRKRVLKSGKDVGKEIIVYGLKVKQKADDQFPKSFTCQSNIKGFNTIKELDWVKIGYIVDSYTNKDGQAVTSHKVMWIGKTDATAQEVKPTPVTEKEMDGSMHDYENGFEAGKASVTSFKPNLGMFEVFKGKYLAKMKETKITPNAFHMLGSFMANVHKSEMAELLEKCKEALK